jgi:hypothetical protein
VSFKTQFLLSSLTFSKSYYAETDDDGSSVTSESGLDN